MLSDELIERKNARLGPFATRYDQPKDVRQTPEPQDPYRTCFDVDRERILLSRPFRRLKHKTQVLWTPRDDHVRTRLTHTLEVSQNARTIGELLQLNTDLIEAIAYAHDLGHTPFGHIGEQALRDCLEEWSAGKTEKEKRTFDHSSYGVKLVSEKEQLPSRPFKGLNLCWQVIDGIQTHMWDWPENPKTLEGRTVRYVDVITFVNHDYDNFVTMGLRLSGRLREALQSIGLTYAERTNRMVGDIVDSSQGKDNVLMSTDMEKLCLEIIDIMGKEIWTSGDWARRGEGARHIIKSLFHHWMEERDDIISKSLPKKTFDRIQTGDMQRIDVITHYIAGMTDNYILEQYRKVFSPEVLDYYW